MRASRAGRLAEGQRCAIRVFEDCHATLATNSIMLNGQRVSRRRAKRTTLHRRYICFLSK
eukprot:390504-Prymnesium_polylepis.1